MKKLVIRFRRKGSRRAPRYDIVVTFSQKRNRSFYFERLGFYSPISLDFFAINYQRLGFRLNKGAYLNPSVKKCISKFIVYSIDYSYFERTHFTIAEATKLRLRNLVVSRKNRAFVPGSSILRMIEVGDVIEVVFTRITRFYRLKVFVYVYVSENCYLRIHLLFYVML